MSKIIDSLQRDHANFEQLLRVLEKELEVFDRAERPDYDVIQAIVRYFETYSGRFHHPKEDLLFAKLKERDAEAAEAVGQLEAEHEEIAAEFQKFAEAVQNVLMEAEMTREAFDHAVRGFIGHERSHIRKEEELFFPAARKALMPEDWAELDAALTVERDPLFSDEIEEEYKALRQQIVRWEREDEAERAETEARPGD